MNSFKNNEVLKKSIAQAFAKAFKDTGIKPEETSWFCADLVPSAEDERVVGESAHD